MATRFTCRSIIPLFVVALLTGTVPVAAQEAADVATETLFEVTFAADDVPAGEVEAVYYRLTLPPGTGLPLLAGPFCGCPGEEVAAGVGAELVQSGSYALRLGAPFVVRRAGQDGEERVAPDTAVTLGPGDAAIYPDYAAFGEVRNAGQEPLVVVGVAIVSAEPSGTPVPDLPSGVRAE